jgi:hypothetical protein
MVGHSELGFSSTLPQLDDQGYSLPLQLQTDPNNPQSLVKAKLRWIARGANVNESLYAHVNVGSTVPILSQPGDVDDASYVIVNTTASQNDVISPFPPPLTEDGEEKLDVEAETHDYAVVQKHGRRGEATIPSTNQTDKYGGGVEVKGEVKGDKEGEREGGEGEDEPYSLAIKHGGADETVGRSEEPVVTGTERVDEGQDKLGSRGGKGGDEGEGGGDRGGEEDVAYAVVNKPKPIPTAKPKLKDRPAVPLKPKLKDRPAVPLKPKLKDRPAVPLKPKPNC